MGGEGVFIHSFNNSSNRYVILDELDESAIMYLSEAGSQKPARDAFAYMRIKPLVFSEWEKHMSHGESPLLYASIASENTEIPKTKEADFRFIWSKNGEAVALIYKNDPIVFISLNEKYGFTKAVTKSTPIVNIWDEKLYKKLFKPENMGKLINFNKNER